MSHELRFQRDFDAPPEEVFEAFTADDGRREMFRSGDPRWIFRSDCEARLARDPGCRS